MMLATNLQLYAAILQTITIIISGAGIIAGIAWNRILTRRKATIDMLLAEQTKIELLEIRRDFMNVVTKDKLKDLINPRSWLTKESFSLISTLNRNELTAIGINAGIIDAHITREYWRRPLVGDWIRCKVYVEAVRRENSNPAFCSEFEKLALQWATGEEMQKIEKLQEDW
jgi:hypothetical protein